MSAALVLLVLLLAAANGANDVSRGIATLVGSGVAGYRRAVLWGSLWTAAGGVLAAWIATGLVATFSGAGLLLEAPAGPAFLTAVAAGAIGWLLLATVTGLPVSTTHALTGGLIGAGLAIQGPGGVAWGAVGAKFALPLAVSPFLALGLMAVAFPAVQWTSRRLTRYCVCVERVELVALGPAAALSGPPDTAARLVAGRDCPPEVVSRIGAVDALHWVTAGLTSFFRGVNDAPKILALGVAAWASAGLALGHLYLLVGLAMGLGSLVGGLRVTETLAHRVTAMTPEQGFGANLVTSVLVGTASRLGLPVSTTHLSSSAIIGLGVHTRSTRWGTVREMLLGWVVTIPVAGALGAGAYALLTQISG